MTPFDNLKRHTPAPAWRCAVFCCVTISFWLPHAECHGDDAQRGPTRPSIAVDMKAGVVAIRGLTKQELEIATQITPDDLAAVLRVAVGDESAASNSDGPWLLGKVQTSSGTITFRPRFPFRDGIDYSAAARLELLGDRDVRLTKTFVRPIAKVEAPEVVAVYPTSSRLPSNLLKFYLHFSKPMQQGSSYRHLKLIDRDANKIVEFPFLELGEELWDPSGKRLTVLFDPGRVKQGLKPREIAGPVLVPGKHYRLLISEDWRGANQSRLAASFSKDFETTTADTIQPSPKKWKVGSPKPVTRDPLVLTFAESLDRAMLERVLSVELDGQAVKGEVTINANETRWVFAPTNPWPSELRSLRIRCDTTLEDNAGNSIGRAFEATSGDAPSVRGAVLIPVPRRGDN